MRKSKKLRIKRNRFIILAIALLIILVIVFINTRAQLVVVNVISKIDDYDYYLESNATKILKNNYYELEKELKKDKVNDESYAKMISKLFVIDYYTLSNKITNKDIGGVQYIHSALQDSFIKSSSDTIYKYVKNNLYNNRKQKLPTVKDVEIKELKKINYKNNKLIDDAGYSISLKVSYTKDYGYPKQVDLKIIHEATKLSIVEIK